VVAEAIEQASPRIPGRRGPILTLIEKQPGFLAPAQIDVVLDAALADGDSGRHLSAEDLHALLEALQDSGSRVVARENPARMHEVVQRRNDGRQKTIDSLGEGLHDEIFAIPIDNVQ
jgi:hypothetical protein